MELRRVIGRAAAALFAWAGGASAAINLELRPVTAGVTVGETVEVGLYAVSDDANEQPIGGIDAILRWDPQVLDLLGRVNNGPYGWSLSWFPNDTQLDGLNDTWSDGDAFYQCLRRNAPNPPAFATPAGLLVTTFRFNTLRPATLTRLDLAPSAGSFTVTRVLDGFDSGVVTGSLIPAHVPVRLCGMASDSDGDCDVDSADLTALLGCLAGPGVPGGGKVGCDAVDVNMDGRVDLHDAAWLQDDYMGR